MNTKPCPKCGKKAVEAPSVMVLTTHPAKREYQWRCACGYIETSRTVTDQPRFWQDDWKDANQRIEEPGKCQLRDACERLLDAVKSEYETGTNADGTPRYAACGEVIEIAERALGIYTSPPA